MNYSPPSTANLTSLKAELGMTGKQMAELFGLAGDQQWRKYTGGNDPRQMSAQMLFFAMAQLELDRPQIDRILSRMRECGAQITLGEDS